MRRVMSPSAGSGGGLITVERHVTRITIDTGSLSVNQNVDDVASPEVLSLLEPFGSEAPAGRDPRADTSPQSTYFRLRDARADARASERGSDNDGRSVGADSHWRVVEENARRILIETGKDLEVAAWMTEASLRLYGLPGLALGAQLMAGLMTEFWQSGLFPSADEGGDEARSIPLAGLNGVSGDGTLLQPLRMLVLFYRPDQTPITLWQYEQAEDVEGIGDAAKKKKRLASGVLVLKDLESEAQLLGQEHLRAVAVDATAALTWWRELARIADAVLGRDAPPTSRVAAILEKILRVASKLSPQTTSEDTVGAQGTDTEAPEDHEDVYATRDVPDGGARRPVTREDMLRNLLIVAEYFRTHEPHSPLAYTLEEAVRRGRLSLLELLHEVVPDAGARGAILSQLGIRPPLD
jgi:type VI secretion system protein ImpA